MTPRSSSPRSQTGTSTGSTRSRSRVAKADAQPALEPIEPPAESSGEATTTDVPARLPADLNEPEDFVPEPDLPPPALFALEEIAAHVMRSIVTNQKALSIVRHNETDKVRIAISVAPEDLGKVIGKQGRTINALRAIVKMAAAARSDTQVVVDLEGRPA